MTLGYNNPRNGPHPRVGVGRLAQLAEQLTLNQWVQGSSPWSVTYMYEGIYAVTPTYAGKRVCLKADPLVLTVT